MNVNDNACFLNKRVALESIASKLDSYRALRIRVCFLMPKKSWQGQF